MSYSSGDFISIYVLDALDANTDKKKHPAPNEWSPAVEKFRIDLARVRRDFVRGFSISLRDYMALASYGEAQYAAGMAKRRPVGIPKTHGDHSQGYAWGVQFSLDELHKLATVFDHKWNGSSYGGPKWFDICKHAANWTEYDKSDRLVQWVDHVADIEHNGGELFNKATPSGVLMCSMSKHELLAFLDFKAVSHNLAIGIKTSKWAQYVRPPIRQLVDRYLAIWDVGGSDAPWKPVNMAYATPPKPSPIKWGTGILQISGDTLAQATKFAVKKYASKLEGSVAIKAVSDATPMWLKAMLGDMILHGIGATAPEGRN